MADDNVIRRELICRQFDEVELTVGDGRTLDLRIVPYNKPTRVRDGDGPFYFEEWAPGVFRNKETKPNDVLVNIEHEKGFAATVARCIGFNDTRDGFDGEFRMLGDPMSDKALELVNAGVFRGVSVEAFPISEVQTEAGVVRRTAAKLKGVALCRNPAYEDSRVLAVREAPEEVVPEEFEPVTVVDISRSEQVLASLGYEPLIYRAIVNRPWNGSAARFDDEQYERSCLVCRPGDESVKERCSLPVLEPDGDLNIQGMHAAAQRLNQTGMSMELKAKAARKLVRYYRQAGETPPPALLSFANR